MKATIMIHPKQPTPVVAELTTEYLPPYGQPIVIIDGMYFGPAELGWRFKDGYQLEIVDPGAREAARRAGYEVW